MLIFANRSLNFGAMGVVMGHELTHGFDDQGITKCCDRLLEVFPMVYSYTVNGFVM